MPQKKEGTKVKDSVKILILQIPIWQIPPNMVK